MSDSQATAELLAYDMTDRLNKSLRISDVKPGEMRQVLGVSESTMTNYLTGRTQPKDGMLRQWAFRCGTPVTFEWLAHGATTPGPEGPDDECAPRDSNSEPADCPIVPLRRRFAPSEPDEVAA